MRARVVVLAASCCESARLLLNSKSSRFPNGLANSSGVVGKYLTDSTGLSVQRVHSGAAWTCRATTRTASAACTSTCRGGATTRRSDSRAGITSSSAAASACRATASAAASRTIPQSRGGGYGAELKDEYRRYYGAFVSFAGRGEQVAREDCYCEIDPERRRQWGIPVLRFHHTWSDHERLQAKHMQETFRSIIEEMGGDADVADADARSRTTAWRSAA